MTGGYKFRIYPSAEQRKSVTPAQYKEKFEWLRGKAATLP